MDLIELLKSFVLGVVEGITEWLPISSTGHMILVDEFLTLNVSHQFLELFLVVIQLGAIMAVVVIYFNKLNPFSRSKTSSERSSTWRLWGMVAIGCIPAAIVGITLDHFFNTYFYNAWTVAIALIAYGIVFIVIENYRAVHNIENRIESVDDIDIATSIKIGLFQCLAIIPGTSRSGSTIIGGMLCGCSRVAATEYTFFLAIPVMLGWGILKTIKMIASGISMSMTEIGVLIVGILTSFVISILAIKFLLKFIKSHDFKAFGIYRIAIGIIVLFYFGTKLIMQF